MTPTAVGWRVVVTAALTVGVWAGTAVGTTSGGPSHPCRSTLLVQNGQAGIVNSPFMEARLTDGTLERVALSAQGWASSARDRGPVAQLHPRAERMQAIAILRPPRAGRAALYGRLICATGRTRLDAARTEKIIDLASTSRSAIRRIPSPGRAAVTAPATGSRAARRACDRGCSLRSRWRGWRGRTLIYLYVVFDVLVVVTDPIPHGWVPVELYRCSSVRCCICPPRAPVFTSASWPSSCSRPRGRNRASAADRRP